MVTTIAAGLCPAAVFHYCCGCTVGSEWHNIWFKSFKKKGLKSIQTGYAVAYAISDYLTKIEGLDILFSFSEETIK